MKFFTIVILLSITIYCKEFNIDRSTKLFKETKLTELNKLKTSYNMLYLDLRDTNRYEKEITKSKEIFRSFGNSLASEGIVFHLKYASLHNRKQYFNTLQNNLNTEFEYNNSPFLIFYEPKNQYKAYKILSFSNTPLICIEESLNRIERLIYNNELSLGLKGNLNSLQELECTISNKNQELLDINMHEIINYIIAFIQNKKQ